VFTGIIEETGTVRSLSKQGRKARLVVEARTVMEGARSGDSISIDGVCQTVAQLLPGAFGVDTLAESLRKTTLGRLVPGSRVNLERALRADARLGGHIVQGHVNGVAAIREIRHEAENVYLVVEIPVDLLPYCVREGSIALDGISLTIADMDGSRIAANIIPVTFAQTTLRGKKAGDLVNVETDIIGRYVESLFPGRGKIGLNPDKMKEFGF
jgi:riboflavin synthase